jgi:spore germination protein YaaH
MGMHTQLKILYISLLSIGLLLVLGFLYYGYVLSTDKTMMDFVPITPDNEAESAVDDFFVVDLATEAPLEAGVSPVVTTSTSPMNTVSSEINLNNPNTQAAAAPVALPSQTTIMAWIYPGKPACSAATEMADGRKIDVLKAEYFTINDGALRIINASQYCNGFSPENIAQLKRHAKEQFVTISSASSADMNTFLSNLAGVDAAVKTLVDFVVTHNLTGIELDFEDFGGWSTDSYRQFKNFVTQLGTALHSSNKKLMIDGPAVSNSTEENWYVWRYRDFVTLPVDYMVVMTYDYQFDHGAGQPVAPLDWIRDSLRFISAQYPKDKLVAGISSYGYQGIRGSFRSTILTNEQMSLKPGYATAERDPRSAELTWQNGNTVYFYQDSISMNAKAAAAAEVGITTVSVWHLGGNPWF